MPPFIPQSGISGITKKGLKLPILHICKNKIKTRPKFLIRMFVGFDMDF
jgi:hypothetical protein